MPVRILSTLPSKARLHVQAQKMAAVAHIGVLLFLFKTATSVVLMVALTQKEAAAVGYLVVQGCLLYAIAARHI